MEMETIVQLISNMGFPIAMTVILLYILIKQSDEEKKNDLRWQELLQSSSKEWQVVINNNTSAMNNMLHKMGELSESNRQLKNTITEMKESE